jgi:uncharacterized protein (TIGR03032 family)
VTSGESAERPRGAHHARLRDPTQVVGLHEEAAVVPAALLEHDADPAWWELLRRLGIRLLVSREYEHLVVALGAGSRGPEVSYLGLPHPSGIAVDRRRGAVHVACTRNPNLLLELRPARSFKARRELAPPAGRGGELVPTRARFLPGCLYLHDLAMIGPSLHGNATGENAVVRLSYDRDPERVWWPRAIERERGGPLFSRNHLQLNSIAAGRTPAASFYSASCERIGRKVPGDVDFPVDGRGVIFSGATREPLVRGLTRPHSARLRRGRLWVANSGHGEVGFVEGERFVPAAKLPGWTRGLCFHGDVLFVATSRVLSRFRAYAPGVDVDESRCALHAIDARTGERLASLRWPHGDQVFAIEWLPVSLTSGLPFRVTASTAARDDPAPIFYSFQV